MVDSSIPTRAKVSEIKAEHFESLGRTVVAFQRLEQAIVWGLLRLMEPKFAPKKFINLQVLINELSFKTKLNVLENIIATNRDYWLDAKNSRYHQDEFNQLLDELRSAINSAGPLEQRRNQLFHSYWSGQSLMNTAQDGTIFRQKIRVRPLSQPMTAVLRPQNQLNIVELSNYFSQ
jgi:hypothetical protein